MIWCFDYKSWSNALGRVLSGSPEDTVKVGGECWEVSGRGVQVIFHLIAREIQVCRKHKMGSSGLSGDHKGKVQTMQHHFNHCWWQEKPSIHFLPLIYYRATERLGPILAVMGPEAGYTVDRPLRHRETHSCSHSHLQTILESQTRRICMSLVCWRPWREASKTLGKYASYTQRNPNRPGNWRRFLLWGESANHCTTKTAEFSNVGFSSGSDSLGLLYSLRQRGRFRFSTSTLGSQWLVSWTGDSEGEKRTESKLSLIHLIQLGNQKHKRCKIKEVK